MITVYFMMKVIVVEKDGPIKQTNEQEIDLTKIYNYKDFPIKLVDVVITVEILYSKVLLKILFFSESVDNVE